jgi:hypothetical protein
MNRESKIVAARTIESQRLINQYIDSESKKITSLYAATVSRLSKEIADEVDFERIVEKVSSVISAPIASSFGVAGAVALKDTTAIMSWDGQYKGFRPVSMSREQLTGLAMTENINGKALTAHLKNDIGKEARRLIAEKRIAGTGIQQMTREIYQEIGGKTSKRYIEGLARTYTATASSYARELVYSANDDMITGFRPSAALELGNYTTGGGTCARCAALDGLIYKKEEDKPEFPLHPY